MGRYGLYEDIELILWSCLSSWYYGYHISELNFPEASLTCTSPTASNLAGSRSSMLGGLPDCLGIDSQRYSAATAIFTVGGLIGSILSARAMDKVGVIGCIKLTGLLNVIGSVIMFAAPHWVVLVAGRVVAGLASGLAITTVAPLLNQISKTSTNSIVLSHSGSIGISNQLAIVLGIFSAQVAGLLTTGMKGDKPGKWRYVVLMSGVVALMQLVFGWIRVPNELMQRRKVASKHLEDEVVMQDEPDEAQYATASPQANPQDEESSPLLVDDSRRTVTTPTTSKHPDTLKSLLSSPALRPHVLLVAFCLITQQFSGINAVLFYSTPVLKGLMPEKSGLIGILVSLINVAMTVPSLVLIDRVGRKPLLLMSLVGMAVSSTLLAIGLDKHIETLSSIMIVTFVASFALALGPVPFLLISELVPAHAVPAVSSLALSCSWTSNFVIALAFLPLRDALAYEDGQGKMQGEGRVFYVFLVIHMVALVVIQKRLYRD
ncbi:hypothetical protein QFC22_003094 [Naganishia vaughanmartiniae]|uniref:Uncharacterized protein n=1 Tax=Naganishia vaughanmartiniae TaxID=1424756 RepID=A0ACC2XA13_9TREE|nr:hypothetical protein QFC22_003094 [Naganishia vaughanmartiniae]